MTQTTGSTLEKKSQRTRKRILDSAMALMQEKGYQGATIREICKKAGVSPASFYCYFQSKNDLLQDIYSKSDGYFGAQLPKELCSQEFSAQIRRFVEEYAQLNIDTALDTVRVLFNPENSWFSQERPMQQTLIRIIELGQTEGTLPSDKKAPLLARDLFVILRGVCYDWCVHEGDYDLKEAMLRHLQYFLHGVC